MNKYFIITVFSFLLGISRSGIADQLSVPVQIDYSLIKKAIIAQLYTGKEHSAELWNDRYGCSYLKLSNPNVEGQNGQIRLVNEVQAKFGTGMGGDCLTILEWAGVLETFQQPALDSNRSILSFPITRAGAYDRQGRHLAIDKLQELIKRFAEPRLASVKVDLNESRRSIGQTLAQFFPKNKVMQAQDMLNSLRFDEVNAGKNGLNIKLVFDAPAKINTANPKPAAPFSETEQKQWQAAWQQWDVFLSTAIKQVSDDAELPELRETLLQILKDSRSAFQAGLKEHDPDSADPVRAFFTHTWQRLSPVLSAVAKEAPGMQGLRYITLIAATDALYELENISAPFGLEISSDGLRRLARLLIAGQQQTQSEPPHYKP
ncbi:conserved hypothetical protein [Candidatus Methylobacter favarea]|uniref:Uncharacterized protein n=1 Tax=Candidatus Methylobacter favarea TaxID=2707345 RepID=A0A8S0Y5W9_9GAMM|nr:hypothetical protein [Candidatus Methylobacter favarea]CAA9889960.1 conserved hypothetical protein [Candidatus Methylobacter favarea]